ncbi:4Fe-4S dicluster domain-containing protein [Amycolatopsis acidicola]|uniref:Ferredoxin n=1 Tax=Amycolatopsis acidicola TaxID=2596893 RepID=A0A5N0VAQ6_9PSEU|nr:ferredoxin [Amycolatopsis acidicola]KAA9162608.1 4Fe-4S dicluster domain-containing protein [Amycolatopsis acidicola]
MAYVITDACLDIMDRSCLTQCPVDCIRQGERMLYINPDDCIDCGACEAVCPQSAIFFDEELPAAQAAYRKVNAEFFAGDATTDHPTVAALPRRS